MSHSSAPIKTLVVDDDSAMCKLVCKILNSHFKETLAVTSTDNVELALGMLVASQFELCITDLDMPQINGFKILKMLKQSNVMTQTIILTSHPEENAMKSAFSLGAADYLLKPINPTELCESVAFLANRIRRYKRDVLVPNEVVSVQ